MTTATKEWLNERNACEEGVDWWIRNSLEGFPWTE